jgi:hypothetical protein
MIRNKILFIFLCLSIWSCTKKPFQLIGHFNKDFIPLAPDFAENKYWAALPDVTDAADNVPLKSDLKDEQLTAQIDVFFLHPTIFTAKPANQYEWNADVNDVTLNNKVDNSTILNQATAFNGSGKIYAPRYRQAHYYAFVTKDKNDKKQSLDLAYQDIKAAFSYYLSHYNHGRPIIIAAHSQGTVHATHLIKDFFDGKPLQKQLVAAYLIGIATQPTVFENIKPCKFGDETGCFVSWNTYAKNYYPEWYNNGLNTAVSTNPLTWTLDEQYAPNTLNKGGVGLNFTMYPQLVDAQNHQGMLWIGKPHITGSFLVNTKVWHRADINFFYKNIRENVAKRIKTYFK